MKSDMKAFMGSRVVMHRRKFTPLSAHADEVIYAQPKPQLLPG